ncbi:hypothetical protein [Pseudosulfitobacter pseudonitzschiae]|uniref:hypothetical protein n=1 Tax=Pseudosulfitobacter pseudonitzschiae TaxID=1402135 RepID=UPI003B7A1026
MKNAIENILELVGPREEIALECGVEPIAVYRWGRNGSIPSRHFAGVLRVSKRNGADVTADTLCKAHDPKRLKSERQIPDTQSNISAEIDQVGDLV